MVWTSPGHCAYNQFQRHLMLMKFKANPRLSLHALAALTAVVLLTCGCAAPAPAQLAPHQSAQVDTFTSTEQPSAFPEQSQKAAADNLTVNDPGSQMPQPDSSSPVQIALIHYRGTVQRLGCCSPGFFEADEFVVIKNMSNVRQDIIGWKIVNITKGYPTFTFPTYFPCVPFVPNEDVVYSVNAPQSLAHRLSTAGEDKAARQDAKELEPVEWSSCLPLEPLDETRMKPLPGQQGKPVPCILNPYQSVLVFTNEIHCMWGGFSFNYGNGNIWNNRQPDTAVLYNARGVEVSRRSYKVN